MPFKITDPTVRPTALLELECRGVPLADMDVHLLNWDLPHTEAILHQDALLTQVGLALAQNRVKEVLDQLDGQAVGALHLKLLINLCPRLFWTFGLFERERFCDRLRLVQDLPDLVAGLQPGLVRHRLEVVASRVQDLS